MARFLALRGAGVFLGCLGAGLTAVSAQTNGAPKPPAPAAAAVNAPAVDDYYVRYGKILKPSDQPGYSYKLSMPFPGIGDVKVPSKEELDMRAKLEQLATLTDDQIREQLLKWPAFDKMSLNDEASMLQRIQAFRDYRHKMASEEAHRIGLLTLSPAQTATFEKEFWTKKIQMDRQLAQQLEGPYKAAQQKLNEDLYREFSSPAGLTKIPPAPAKPKIPKPQTAPLAASPQ